MAALFSLLSIAINLISTQATNITIFIRDEGAVHPISIDIPSDITADALYEKVQKVPGIGIGDVLSVGNFEIPKSDSHTIADLAICPEAMITLIRRQPTDAESLYHFAKDLKNKELISWWSLALKHHRSPPPREIQVIIQQTLPNHVCLWPDIVCDRQYNISHVSLDTESVGSLGFPTPTLQSTLKRWGGPVDTAVGVISGKLVLRYLPRTVTTLQAIGGRFCRFDEVDFSGLTMHKLHSVVLDSNAITTINWEELKESSIQRLHLGHNQISEVDFDALKDTSLEVLELNDNRIQEVDFKTLGGTKITRLDLQGNNISELVFEGVEESQLQILELQNNPIDMIDFKGIKASSLRILAINRPQCMTRNLEEFKEVSVSDPYFVKSDDTASQ